MLAFWSLGCDSTPEVGRCCQQLACLCVCVCVYEWPLVISVDKETVSSLKGLRLSAGDFQVLSIIGRGHFGEVSVCVCVCVVRVWWALFRTAILLPSFHCVETH